MAEAIKCDRCGHYDNKNDNSDMRLEEWRNGRHFSGGYYDEQDLCRGCLQELKDWFERKNDTE